MGGGSYYSKGFDAAATLRCPHRSAIGTAQWVVFGCLDLSDAIETIEARSSDPRVHRSFADLDADRAAVGVMRVVLGQQVELLRDGGGLLCLRWDGMRCPF